MKTIHKFAMVIGECIEVEMPAGARPISIQLQPNLDTQRGVQLSMWAIVDTDAAMVLRRFFFVATGAPMPDVGVVFLQTLQFNGGTLVFHVFEEANFASLTPPGHWPAN